MSFASFTEDPQPSAPPADQTPEVKIEQEWWPDISLTEARETVRIHGTVSDARLLDALSAAAISVNIDLSSWRAKVADSMPDGMSQQQAFLYRRAVHFHAKAELLERYRDFDGSAERDRLREADIDPAEDARRVERWAISELIGRPRLTVELM